MKLFGELKEKLKADVNELEEKQETEESFHLAGSNVTKRATLRSLFQTDGQLENDRNIEHNTELFANDFEINILDLLELDDNDNINDTLKWQLELLHCTVFKNNSSLSKSSSNECPPRIASSKYKSIV